MRSRPTKLAWLLVVPLVLVGVAVLLIRGWPRLMPSIRGRVLDARSGAPIADFLVERRLFEKGPPDLVDSRTGDFVRGSFVKVKTDKDGRFELPAAFVWGLSGMAWFAYKPSWMPGFGCYQEDGWSSGSCGGSPAIVPDPYVKASFVRHSDRVEMEIRVFPPTLEDVTLLTFDPRVGRFVPRAPVPGKDDPWANYFQRLNTAAQDEYLDAGEFAAEAVRYLNEHDLKEGMLAPLAELAGDIRPPNKGKLQHERYIVLKALNQYCRSEHASPVCEWPIVWNAVRDYDREYGGRKDRP